MKCIICHIFGKLFSESVFLEGKNVRFFHFIFKQKLILVTDEIHHSTWLLCFEMRPSFYFYSNKSDHNNFDCCFLREMLECLVVSVHKEIRY